MSEYLAFLAAMLTFAFLRELGITDLFHWVAILDDLIRSAGTDGSGAIIDLLEEALKDTWIRHIAGAYVDGLQVCANCGQPLIDRRTEVTISGGPAVGGFNEGSPVYVQRGAQTTVLRETESWITCIRIISA